MIVIIHTDDKIILDIKKLPIHLGKYINFVFSLVPKINNKINYLFGTNNYY